MCNVHSVLPIRNLESHDDEEVMGDDKVMPHPFRGALLDDANSNTPRRRGASVYKGNDHSRRQCQGLLDGPHIRRYWSRRPAEYLGMVLRQDTIGSQVLGLPYNVAAGALGCCGNMKI